MTDKIIIGNKTLWLLRDMSGTSREAAEEILRDELKHIPGKIGAVRRDGDEYNIYLGD
jgi:hypothetical protein